MLAAEFMKVGHLVGEVPVGEYGLSGGVFPDA
jgi:hypothetical protein